MSIGWTGALRGAWSRAGGGGTGLVSDGMAAEGHDKRSVTGMLSLAELSIDIRAVLSAGEM